MSLTISAAEAPTMLRMSGSFSPSALRSDGLDLHFVVPALGKERADGTVGEAAGEDFLFRGTAFALEVAAGEFAGRGRFFAVIHGEREEVLAFLGLGGGDGGDDDDGFAQRTVTAPSACLASLPVSMMICLSPMAAVIFCDIMFLPPPPEELQ